MPLDHRDGFLGHRADRAQAHLRDLGGQRVGPDDQDGSPGRQLGGQ